VNATDILVLGASAIVKTAEIRLIFPEIDSETVAQSTGIGEN
jgi:hypothetical protein